MKLFVVYGRYEYEYGEPYFYGVFDTKEAAEQRRDSIKAKVARFSSFVTEIQELDLNEEVEV